MGRNGFAYFDQDTGDYHGSTGTYTAWNQGYAYRNDGVDIEECSDKGNGYNVGWTSDNEFLVYTLQTDTAAAYTLDIRSASGGGGGTLLIDANGVPVCEPVKLPGTSGWQNWQTSSVQNIILPAGYIELKLTWLTGGSNLNFIRFHDPVSTSGIPFVFTAGETNEDGSLITFGFNKEITTPEGEIANEEFHLYVNSVETAQGQITADQNDPQILHLSTGTEIDYGDIVELSYDGSSVYSGEQALVSFQKKNIVNRLPVRYTLPCKIEAENYYTNVGLQLENCEDTGGGLNTGYANPGDYLDYRINVKESSYYLISYRVATIRTNAEIFVQVGDGTTFTTIDTVKFTATGDWQSWKTQSSLARIEAGKYLFRIKVKQSEFNLNWFQFTKSSYTGMDQGDEMFFTIFPNPTRNQASVVFPDGLEGTKNIQVIDMGGRTIWQDDSSENVVLIETSGFSPGIYMIRARSGNRSGRLKLVVE